MATDFEMGSQSLTRCRPTPSQIRMGTEKKTTITTRTLFRTAPTFETNLQMRSHRATRYLLTSQIRMVT